MALSKLAPGIDLIRGPFAGQYFKHDNAGQHIVAAKRCCHKTYKKSFLGDPTYSVPGRGLLTKGFTAVADLWKALAVLAGISGSLYPAMPWVEELIAAREIIDLWAYFAATAFAIGAGGQRITLSAYQWWIKANTVRVSLELNPQYNPDFWDEWQKHLRWGARGTPEPLNTGLYVEKGVHNNRPFYRHRYGGWHCWMDIDNHYYISVDVGTKGTWYWRNDSLHQGGLYHAMGSAAGAIVLDPWREKYVD